MPQELLDIGFANDRTTGKEQWLTPPWILAQLGEFDLDPCFDNPRPWDTAKNYFTSAENGLFVPWPEHMRVWLNPPYGTKETSRWIKKMSHHKGGGIALIFARTETQTFFPWIWDYATAFLFIKGRLSFCTVEGKESGTAGAPSMLIAFSDFDADVLASASFKRTIPGKFLINEKVKAD